MTTRVCADGMRTRAPRKVARKPGQDRSRATVDAILEAAARILEREGAERLSTNRVARDAGVSIGSLYEYFDGRDAIVRALCERHIASVRALVDRSFEALADAPLDLAVDAFIDGLFDLHGGRLALHGVLHRELPQRLGMQPFIESDRYLEERLVQWLRDRGSTLDADALETQAFVVVRAGRAVTIHALAEELDEERRSRVRRAVKDMVLRALSAP